MASGTLYVTSGDVIGYRLVYGNYTEYPIANVTVSDIFPL